MHAGMVGSTTDTNRMHSAARLGSKLLSCMSCFYSPCWQALEDDVTLTEVMNIEYFSDLSIGCSYLSIASCVSARRRSRHPNPSRAMLPQRCQKTPV